MYQRNENFNQICNQNKVLNSTIFPIIRSKTTYIFNIIKFKRRSLTSFWYQVLEMDLKQENRSLCSIRLIGFRVLWGIYQTFEYCNSNIWMSFLQSYKHLIYIPKLYCYIESYKLYCKLNILAILLKIMNGIV